MTEKVEKTAAPSSTGMGAVAKYFGIRLADFRVQWAQLTDTDKAQLKEGIGSGSLTY